MIKMIYATPEGEWESHEELSWAGRSGNQLVEPLPTEWIEMPEGATLAMMPDRAPIGFNAAGELQQITTNAAGEQVWAIAALLPQGFTRTLLPAVDDRGQVLPLLGYTAVGEQAGQLYVAACQTDEHEKWHPKNYNTEELARLIAERKQELPQNEIVEQLAHCAFDYGCFTAQNIFYRRFEGALPVSPICNADCVGCISLQEAECCPSPQQRIKKAPSAESAIAMASLHLQKAQDGIISFGQGCEGEPSLQGDLIAEIIRGVRALTPRGTINMNTNGGCTAGIKKAVDAGIDSLRVSMISALESSYNAYHRPKNYSFADVLESLAYARAHGVWVSLNLLCYPGLNDKEEEVTALLELLEKYDIQQIQLRNLNIDPQQMTELYGDYLNDAWGVGDLLACLRENAPAVQIGNYSKPQN